MPDSSLLLDPQTLHRLQSSNQFDSENTLIIDLGAESRYIEQHIPGAICVNPQYTVAGTPPAPGKMPSQAQVQQLFQHIGYSPNKNIIVYDDEGGGWAGRFIWLLDSIGHQHTQYLDGGLQAWIHDGLDTESGVNSPSPSSVEVQISRKASIDADSILAELDNPSFQIWDARSAAEYAGIKVLAQKGGHIPGAINVEWTQAMDPARGLRIRHSDELVPYLEEKGFDLSRPLVTHCQTHHRSGFTYLVAKLLGFPHVRAYDGSWSEWGNRPDTPVA